jgi:hypothetical protein
VRNLLRTAGVSRAVAYGVLSRATAAAVALAAMAAIAAAFAPELQGYYYTFQNLLALQVFAEMGLGIIITQFASHEWASLRLEPDGTVGGDPGALSRLVGIGRSALAWYAGAGAAVAAGVAAVGWAFFSGSRGGDGVDWRGPWLALCLFAGVRLATLPFAYLLEGCNQVAEVHFFRWMSALIGGAALLAALGLGAGLWAPAAGAAAEAAWGLAYFGIARRRFARQFFARPAGPVVSWRREILPLQGRTAISWISGFFCLQFFGPVLFRFQGPAAAGRWGMTWSMLLLVTSVATLWVSTRLPQFGVWIARREFGELDRHFRRSAALSVAVAGAGAAAVLAGVALAGRLGHPVADRLLTAGPTALLALAVWLNQLPAAQGLYLRAHRREPLAGLSVAQAVLTAGLTLLLARQAGLAAVALGHLAVVALVVVPASTFIWRRCRREWHAAPAAEA